MNVQQPLGTATWGNGGNMLQFISSMHLVSVGMGDGLQIFDMKTGLPQSTWVVPNEHLCVFAALGTDRFLVGGSFGIMYTIERHGETWDLIEEREILSYFDRLAYSLKRDLVAVSCVDKLCLMPGSGKVNRVYIEFGGERIQSINWIDSLNAFFVVTSKSISLISTAGERTIVASFNERVLAAAFVDQGARIISFIETRENQGTLSSASMANPRKSDWEKVFVVDDHFVGPIANEYREGTIVISETENTILLGINKWVRRLNLDGNELGQPRRLFRNISSLAVSTDERHFAAGSGRGILNCWDEHGKEIQERMCHSGPVAEIEFSADDVSVFTGSNSPEYFCWDIATGAKTWNRRFEATTSAGMSLSRPDELIISVWKGGAHRSAITEIRSLDPVTGLDRPMFSVSHRHPTKIFRNNASIFTICDGDFLSDGFIEQRNINTGRIQLTLTGGNSEFTHVCAHNNRIAGTDKNHTWLWDLLDSSKRLDFPLPDDSSICRLYFSDHGHLVSITEKGVFRLDIPKSKWTEMCSFESPILACSQPTNGRMVLCGKGGNVEIRSSENFRIIDQLKIIHEGSDISGCGVSHSGAKLVTGANNGTLILTSLR
jgi:WD40 repeat protein